MKKRIAVIPARGGSKRIPKKNIKMFCGKPIIAYSIHAAIEANLFDHIIVSTDSDEIARIANKFGAEIPFKRPTNLSDEYTGTNMVVKHAIGWYLNEGINVDYACCIYATAPFLQAYYLAKGYEILVSSQKAFSFSVSSYPFPIQRALRITSEGFVDAIFPEHINKRSQDFEEAYHDAGQFYWGETQAFLNDTVTFSSASVPIVLPRYLVQDIDTIEDWETAESMFRAQQLAKVEESKERKRPV